jgi:hypothetical protein
MTRDQSAIWAVDFTIPLLIIGFAPEFTSRVIEHLVKLMEIIIREGACEEVKAVTIPVIVSDGGIAFD